MIGILSDSHDHLTAIKKAVKIFNKNQVELVIHAGDLISPFTAGEFLKLHAPLEAIYGNNDGERDGLKTAFSDLCILEDFKDISYGKRRIAVIHGHLPPLVDSLVHCGKYDIVIRGHTHQFEISNGKTMLINPGECCGYLTGKKSLVLIDPHDLSYEMVEF
ncbi:metallophosphoesterase [Methanobacterium alkalithermotolerans]|uniref:Phosphoesterase n=1 Tax=Methanobacterium alkalithermotolerans TaxID=2731220 RepID=A0A8T8K5Y7_9EURY|nr:metallophosphoesterase [Methanobacterium alkalithermotolerans]QUH23252.1 metallophosphoesterase [Methanobacterium alkalithermotolerans]RJS49251.1 MAG: YfcE family phosphodiesterase [Methanobacterium sp.]